MVPLINIASVVSIDAEGVSGLFVVDHAAGRVYRLATEESDPVETGRVMMAIRGQMRANLPNIPHDDIAAVMRAEKTVSDSGSNKIKRGSDE
jgi:hypothetical protein